MGYYKEEGQQEHALPTIKPVVHQHPFCSNTRAACLLPPERYGQSVFPVQIFEIITRKAAIGALLPQ
jgi:hypothetical protein